MYQQKLKYFDFVFIYKVNASGIYNTIFVHRECVFLNYLISLQNLIIHIICDILINVDSFFIFINLFY